MPNQNEIIVLDLNDGNIDKFAKDMPNHGKVFIAFLADWCGHCQNFKPEWEKIKSHLKENPDGSVRCWGAVEGSGMTMQAEARFE